MASEILSWTLVCNVVLALSKGHVLDQVKIGHVDSIEPQMDVQTESNDRAKREIQPLTSTSKSSRFTEIGGKIEEIIRKIKPDDTTASKFKEVLSNIDENYNTYRSEESEIGDSPVRMSMIKCLEPIYNITQEMKSNQCQINQLFLNTTVKKSVLKVNEWISAFWEAKKQVDKLPMADQLAEAELLGINGTLTDLNLQMMPTLKALVDASDQQGGQNVMCTLAGLTTAYVTKMLFVLDLHSYMADSSYGEGNMERYNGFFESINTNFRAARNILMGGGTEVPMIPTVLSAMKPSRSSETEWTSRTKRLLERLKTHLQQTQLPLIVDFPETLAGKPDFEAQPIKTPLGHWKDGANVSYAVLYRQNGKYSRLGRWMDTITVDGEANPTIRIRVHPKRYDRFIFRRFDDKKPSLVGVLNDKYQTEFRDIHRDLYEAAASSDKNALKDGEVLIRNGADVNAVFEGGRRAIHAAALSDNVQFAKKFLVPARDSGKSIAEFSIEHSVINMLNARDHRGYTPLHVASEAGNRRFIELLVEAGAGVNEKTSEKQWTPLHIAAGRGFVSAMKTLMKSRDIDVNARDVGGFRPVHHAVGGGIPVLNVLMADNRTDIQATSDKGISPIHIAIMEEYADVVAALLSNPKGPSNSNAGISTISIAAIVGNIEVMQHLVKCDSVGEKYEGINRWTPLHFAVALENNGIVDALMSRNTTDINAKSINNITPLHIAVVTNQREIVEKLMKQGARVDEETVLGVTPIQLALMHNYDEIASLLTENDSNVQTKTYSGETLLSYAIANNKFGIIKSLAKKESNNINIRSEFSGETPLHIAIRKCNLEVIKLLVKLGADVNAQDRHGDAPLHYAAIYHNDTSDIIQLLIKNGANVNSTNVLLRSALHLAVENGKLKQVRSLVENKINVDAKDYQGMTALHIAADKEGEGILNHLISNGADVNVLDDEGQSPLHLAARRNNLRKIIYLVSNYASIDQPDYQRRTPLFWAVEHDNKDVVKYLLKIGATAVPRSMRTFGLTGVSPFHGFPLTAPGVLGQMDIIQNLPLHTITDTEQTELIETASAVSDLYVLEYLFDSLEVDESIIRNSIYKAVRVNSEDVVAGLMDRLRLYGHPQPADMLCYARCNLGVISFLINLGENVNYDCRSSANPIANAAEAGCVDAVTLLADNGADTTFSIGEYSRSALWAAVKNGQVHVVNYLVQRGVDVNMANHDGETLLHILLDQGSIRADNKLEAVKSLVENGANIHVKDKKGRTPLSIAASSRFQVDVVNYLLDRGATLGVSDIERLTDFIENQDVVKPLAEKGGMIDLIKKAGNKTLLNIIQNRNSVMLNYLMSEGLEFKVTDDEGRTPLHLMPCDEHVATNLVGQGIDINSKTINGTTPLHALVSRCWNTEVVKFLISRGADVNSVDSEGQTPLHLVRECNFNMIRTLVENGANVSSATHNGRTPLLQIIPHCTCTDAGAVNYLIEKGASVHSADSDGQTPLHLVRRCPFDFIPILIDNGAEVNSKTTDGTTPMHVAVDQCYGSEVVDYLISKGASVNSTDSKGRAPLHFSGNCCNLAVTESLVNNGADINSVTDEGMTPLLNTLNYRPGYCTDETVLRMLKFLISRGASLNVSDHKGRTPLHYEVESRSEGIKVVKYLIENGAHVDSKSANGKTPLHLAAKWEKLDTITHLIDKKADVNAVDSTGNTPLFYAVQTGNLDIVKYLLKNGADKTIRNNYNELPLNYITINRSNSHNYYRDSYLDIFECLKEN